MPYFVFVSNLFTSVEKIPVFERLSPTVVGPNAGWVRTLPPCSETKSRDI